MAKLHSKTLKRRRTEVRKDSLRQVDFRTKAVADVEILYRKARPTDAPVILFLMNVRRAATCAATFLASRGAIPIEHR